MSVERMTTLVARALKLSPQQLLDCFIPATADHLAGVLALRHALFGAGIYWDDVAYLCWRYRFGSTTQGRGNCWVLLLDGQVAGMVGTEEVLLQRGNERVAAWSTMDIAIDPRYEGSGLGSWMNLRLCQAAGCAITIGSNEKSRNMITRTFRRLPNRRSYVLPIRFQRLLTKRIRVPIIASVLAPIIGAMAAAWRTLALLGAQRRLQFKTITCFDRDAADLLPRAVDPQEWQLARSVDYLNWRLFGNPRVRYRVVGAYDHGVLAGFMATMLRGERGGPLVVVLSDWVVERARFRPVFKALCADAVRLAVSSGAESVNVTAYHARSENLLRRLGFTPRFGAYETVAVYSTDKAKLLELHAPAPWFITEANTDRDNL